MFSDALALVRLYEIEFGLDELVRLDPERAKAEAERCRSEVDPALLAKYERLKRRFGAGVLAEVQNGTCSGCRIALPKTLIARLKHGIAFCEHCGRIIYDADHAYHYR